MRKLAVRLNASTALSYVKLGRRHAAIVEVAPGHAAPAERSGAADGASGTVTGGDAPAGSPFRLTSPWAPVTGTSGGNTTAGAFACRVFHDWGSMPP